MGRPVWIALAALVAAGLFGALALRLALDTTNGATASLAPRGARVFSNEPLGRNPDQRIVKWRIRGHPEDPSSGLYGLSIWQGKRRLYSHRAASSAQGIHVETGDFSGDGRDDVLVFEDTGGSGGCGVYRALVTAPSSVQQVNARLLCVDRGSIHLEADGLVFRIGEAKDPKTAQEIHCCFRFLRTTVKRWNGQRLVVVRRSLRRLERPHPWPPGGYPP